MSKHSIVCLMCGTGGCFPIYSAGFTQQTFCLSLLVSVAVQGFNGCKDSKAVFDAALKKKTKQNKKRKNNYYQGGHVFTDVLCSLIALFATRIMQNRLGILLNLIRKIEYRPRKDPLNYGMD